MALDYLILTILGARTPLMDYLILDWDFIVGFRYFAMLDDAITIG